MSFRIVTGDCLRVMTEMEPDSIDAIVTDPPYGLSFMGKDWDHGIPGAHFWQEAIRVAKPGAHLLAFGGTRTFHRLTCAIEDAGWDIRDCIMWVYGSGFPKSLDVSKAIDKMAGEKREVVGKRFVTNAAQGSGLGHGSLVGGKVHSGLIDVTAPATAAARQWQGWGTALKPAWEPIIVARKPLAGTVAENVLKHGTGAINVDACRIDTNGETLQTSLTVVPKYGDHGDGRGGSAAMLPSSTISKPSTQSLLGRWPANVIHDGSEEVVRLMPEEDSGSAARFFYCAKADRAEREIGMAGFCNRGAQKYGSIRTERGNGYEEETRIRNNHPTVKPLDLMQYLVRLVAPKGATVLDPFTGSGSTGIAALREGCNFVGIELDPEYAEIARARIKGDAPLINLEG